MFSYLFRSSIISLNRFVYQSKIWYVCSAQNQKSAHIFEIINDKKNVLKQKIMIIINKSFVLERSRIIFFSFFLLSMRSYILGHHSLFSICGFLIFQKKDKYVFWKFKQMTIFEVLVFHKTVVVMQIVYHLLEDWAWGISFELRHPYSGNRDNCHAHVHFNAIFFYFYPFFRTGL